MPRIKTLRDHAAKFRELARKETTPAIRARLRAMAEQCENVIEMIEHSLSNDKKNKKGAP